jgi:hypothetical protein
MGSIYSLTVETTANATAGAAGTSSVMQLLMPASREMRLLAVLINQNNTAAGDHPGRWVVDRCTAVATGSALTPKPSTKVGATSAITDSTIAISTTLLCAPTVSAADSAISELAIGVWNIFSGIEHGGLPVLRSGLNGGFAIRRATAPTGTRACHVTAFWEEDPD